MSCLLDTVHSVGLSPVVDETSSRLRTSISEEILSSSEAEDGSLPVPLASSPSLDTSSDCGVKVIGTEAGAFKFF